MRKTLVEENASVTSGGNLLLSTREPAATKQNLTEMAIDSVSDKLSSLLSLRTALPTGRDAHERRPKHRRKRRSRGNDEDMSRQNKAQWMILKERQELEQEKVVTISVAELEKWQQKVIHHVEDHFTNEQLKRIAEFGRVHGTMMQEARQYVSNMETQLQHQFQIEQASLRAQAEEYVKKTAEENESLQQQLQRLKQQMKGLEDKIERLEHGVDEINTDKAQTSERQGHCTNNQPIYSVNDGCIQVTPANGDIEIVKSQVLQDLETKGDTGSPILHLGIEQKAGLKQQRAPHLCSSTSSANTTSIMLPIGAGD